MKNIKRNGFTIVELIVVMTIIMIVTVVGIVSYTGATKRARDSRRISDMEKIRLALEMYRQGTGSTYPVTGTLDTALVPKYLQALPKDPKDNVTDYNYTRSAGYNYLLNTTLEATGLGYSISSP